MAARDSVIGDRSVHGRTGARVHPVASAWTLILVAWPLLAVAIVVAGASYRPVAIVLALVATALIVLAPIVPRPLERLLRSVVERIRLPLRRLDGDVDRLAPRWSGVASVACVGGAAAIAGIATGELPRFGLAGVVGVAACTVVFRTPPLVAWAVAAVLTTLAANALIVAHTPSDNDVWFILQGGTDALARGQNPYTGCWAGNTDPATTCTFPYLPATLLALLPAHLLLGDVRYGLLVALLLGSLATLYLAPRRIAPALALLPVPLGVVMVDRAWNEPLLFAGIALMVVAVERRWVVVAVVALAIALATKQHVLVLLPLAAWWPAFGLRRTAGSVALASAITLPFLIADPSAFMTDTVEFFVRSTARQDSVSLHALLLAGGIDLPSGVAVVGVVVTLLLVGWRTTRDALGFVLGCAAVLAAFNLLNKQSFFNYHAMVLSLLAMGLALAAGRLDAGDTRSEAPATA